MLNYGPCSTRRVFYSATGNHYMCCDVQGIATDLVVQVVLIAESMRLQAMLGTYGIQTQTPHEVEPVQVTYPSHTLSFLSSNRHDVRGLEC